MNTKFKETAENISLHGLGFLQIKLEAGQRLHIWHPNLPRRACSEDSAIHDHRFGFSSTVLKGTQINNNYKAERCSLANATHRAYLHEGERSPQGNRPWISEAVLRIVDRGFEVTQAGSTYFMAPYEFHSTKPADDGRVATLMTKTKAGSKGARSLCAINVKPDTDFDRFQMTEADMWDIVQDVLSG